MKNIFTFVVILSLSIVITGILSCRDPFIPRQEEPHVIIERPPGYCIDLASYARIITFGWSSGVEYEIKYIRYLWTKVIDSTGIYDPTFNIVGDLNENPWRYEHLWSPWIPYNAPGDSGRVTILGDDEILEMNKQYVFAVQAKDYIGLVTKVFDKCRNVRQFIVTNVAGPLLTVIEPYLGGYKFIGTSMTPVNVDLPPGVPLNFYWSADASSYGGEIVGYRYGWDVVDIHNPDDWAVPLGLNHTSAPEITFYSGVHALFVEVVDNAAMSTLGLIQINIFPFTMERNLLWVDDFYSIDFVQVLWSHPTETQHDDFWTDICGRAIGFDPAIDIYDCKEHNLTPLTLLELGLYKNIIWTFSSDQDTWSDVVLFTPESQIVGGSQGLPNPLPIFLVKGGHILTLGRSERDSGLAAIFPQPPWFPASFIDDIAPSEDTSGVHCMGYRDYCVTVVDKVQGQFKNGDNMPPGVIRSLDRDAMRHAYRDDLDPYTILYPGLPEELQLWSEVTAPGRFFDPVLRGFYYVEAYNPEYYMSWKGYPSRDCFHPMFRMKARNTLSAIDDCAVAIWISKYDDVVPDVGSGVAVAAPSLHFGLPLWFFNRAQVDSIIDVVFTEWQIKAP